MSEAEVLFEKRGRIGLITLNRPKALNALTLGMVDLMHAQLDLWAVDPTIEAVVAIGSGERAFCAGGDIRALYESGKAHTPYAIDFYGREYQLNTRIKRYAKPYVAILNGITMGGGVGISVHGQFVVACPQTVFAMPETGIGLFPDVGGTYFLPRMPGELGLYLALTGARLKGSDLVHAALATHYTEGARLAALVDALAYDERAPAAVLEAFADRPEPSSLEGVKGQIDQLFAGASIEAILGALDGEGSDFARDARRTILTKSPTSTKVAFRQLRSGATLSFEDCMRLEFRLTHRFMTGHDFYEGVRAVIIEKDQAPKWFPAALDAVSDAAVDAYFQPLPGGELPLPRCEWARGGSSTARAHPAGELVPPARQ
ncbi:MAG: enoyl-CoA hydratase/isomerase family protein [Alphaproteobacteria bacterium]|nr:enoyl-CoA hydratase/isomerase family protein [Alphaproteobacteria bacterium]